MTALAELLDDSAAALARLQLKLTISPPPASTPTTAICPACGQIRPAPAATFRPAIEQLTTTTKPKEG